MVVPVRADTRQAWPVPELPTPADFMQGPGPAFLNGLHRMMDYARVYIVFQWMAGKR